MYVNYQKKVSRSVGVLLKLRHFVPTNILVQLYYSIVFPYISYGVIIWGNTYKTNIQPIVILQKKAIRIITFSHYRAHTSPIFKRLKLLKFSDIVLFNTTLFMYRLNNNKLPYEFMDFFFFC